MLFGRCLDSELEVASMIHITVKGRAQVDIIALRKNLSFLGLLPFISTLRRRHKSTLFRHPRLDVPCSSDNRSTSALRRIVSLVPQQSCKTSLQILNSRLQLLLLRVELGKLFDSAFVLQEDVAFVSLDCLMGGELGVRLLKQTILARSSKMAPELVTDACTSCRSRSETRSPFIKQSLLSLLPVGCSLLCFSLNLPLMLLPVDKKLLREALH